MKHYIALFLGMAMLALLAGCGRAEVKIDPAQAAATILETIEFSEELHEVTALEGYFALEEGVTGVMYMSSGKTAEEVVVLMAENAETAQRMKANLQEFLDEQAEAFRDYLPAEIDRIEKAVLEQSGSCVILCVAEDEQAVEACVREILS